MKVWQVAGYGQPEALHLGEGPVPVPAEGQVRLRMLASAVNPVDWKIAHGDARLFLRPSFPYVPGLEGVGVVDALGPGVRGLAEGDRVTAKFAAAEGGAMAEYAVLPVDRVALTPPGLPDGEAAGLGLAGMTALQALRDHAALRPSERVLVLGASGGVGHLAVQIAVRMGARVTGVCSTPNVPLVRGLGAEDVIDYRTEELSSRGTFPVVLDCVGLGWKVGRRLVDRPRGGRWVTVSPIPSDITAFLAHKILPGPRLSLCMLHDDKADLQTLHRWCEAGALRVVVADITPFPDLPRLWAASQSGRTVGKLVLRHREGA